MIIALSGALGSGKSSVSQALATRLNWPRVSFGGYVRTIADERNLPKGRETLQALGAELLQEMGAKAFCIATLRQAGWKPGMDVVLDGVRHQEVLETLQQLDRTHLIFLSADEQTRVSRLRADGRAEDDLSTVEQHSTEVQVSSVLRELAEYVVDATKPLGLIVDEISHQL